MKILLLLFTLVVVFGMGYYTGQRPDEVKQKLRDLSGEVLEKTIGLEQGLSLRKEFLQVKERLIEGKAKLLDHEYEGAAQELQQALEHLKGVDLMKSSDGQTGKQVKELMGEVQSAQERLAKGEGISREVLDGAQAKLNELLP